MKKPREMKRKEIKEYAQEEILQSLVLAYYRIMDDVEMDEEDKKILKKELYRQADRVAKLFGYEEYPFLW